jgi:hypothetical protein
MFAQELCHSQIEYLSNSIDLNLKDRAKRNHKYSFFNLQYSFPASPGWVSGVSVASGRERPVRSKKKLRNIEHRIMHAARRELLCRTVHFIKD